MYGYKKFPMNDRKRYCRLLVKSFDKLIEDKNGEIGRRVDNDRGLRMTIN